MTTALSTIDNDALSSLLDGIGVPSWRLSQLKQAVWQPFVSSLSDIRQFPEQLRSQLAEHLDFTTVGVIAETEADGGQTVKLLCQLHDGETVETVAMATAATGSARRRATVCVSSQVGCAVGCPFCATGQMGLRRNCSAAEIVDQVRAAATALHRRSLGPVTHVVYMGMGEPLANEAATVESLTRLSTDAGISERRITVSTSGIVPAIRRLAERRLKITLAISLHAATDELRDSLVPINRAHPLDSLLSSAAEYASVTGRRISFEWCLIGGINDTVEQATKFGALAAALGAHINVIPMNHVDGSPWGPPPPATVRAFLAALDPAVVTVRDTRGSDMNAACGQLRASLEVRRHVREDGSLSPPRRQPA